MDNEMDNTEEQYIIKNENEQYLKMSNLQDLPNDIKFSTMNESLTFQSESEAHVVLEILKKDLNLKNLTIVGPVSIDSNRPQSETNDLYADIIIKVVQQEYSEDIQEITKWFKKKDKRVNEEIVINEIISIGMKEMQSSDVLKKRYVDMPDNSSLEPIKFVFGIGLKKMKRVLSDKDLVVEIN